MSSVRSASPAVTTRISDGSTTSHTDADVSGSNVVWQGYDGTGYEIYVWGGATTAQITDDGSGVDDPDISGSRIVWRSHQNFYFNISLATHTSAVPTLSTAGAALELALLMGVAAWAIQRSARRP